MKIKYITSNAKKFEEAQHILAEDELERVSLDLVEIQGNHHDIIKTKAIEASRIINCPLVVEDVAFCCPSLGGLPGPYVKAFLESLGERGLYELIHKYPDHRVEAICLAAYIAPGKSPEVFEGMIEGTVVAPRGELRHGERSCNTIFQPKGFSKTFGEMTMAEHSKCSMRAIALNKLRKWLHESTAKINEQSNSPFNSM